MALLENLELKFIIQSITCTYFCCHSLNITVSLLFLAFNFFKFNCMCHISHFSHFGYIVKFFLNKNKAQ